MERAGLTSAMGVIRAAPRVPIRMIESCQIDMTRRPRRESGPRVRGRGWFRCWGHSSDRCRNHVDRRGTGGAGTTPDRRGIGGCSPSLREAGGLGLGENTAGVRVGAGAGVREGV
ncbi:hypothetical protein Ssi03_21410 [Sphaerisporangium siamense]|nr:hypothetical protein Ssi03_21410 [Sphaerisporangium siamense]